MLFMLGIGLLGPLIAHLFVRLAGVVLRLFGAPGQLAFDNAPQQLAPARLRDHPDHTHRRLRDHAHVHVRPQTTTAKSSPRPP